MHEGSIRMQGSVFDVVKAYEEYIHNPSLSKVDSRVNNATADGGLPQAVATPVRGVVAPAEWMMQEPRFQPHTMQPHFPALPDNALRALQFVAQGGISRWESDKGVKITGFTIQTGNGESNEVLVLEPMAFVMHTCAEIDGLIACRYGIAVHDYQGNCLTRIFSPVDRYTTRVGDYRKVTLLLNPNQLGPGEYTVGISISSDLPLEQINHAARYDLLSRSFAFRVVVPDSLNATASAYYHSAEWQMQQTERLADV